MSRTIPGRLDLAALAKLHKPRDRATLRVCAVELSRRNMTARDIAIALELSEAVVGQLLQAPELDRYDQE